MKPHAPEGRRLAAFHFPYLQAEIQAPSPDCPVALHDARGRVCCVNRPAAQLGIAPGLRVADIQCLSSRLYVAPLEPSTALGIQALASGLQDLSPGLWTFGDFTIFLDLQPLAPLLGEKRLLTEAQGRLAAHHYQLRTAVAGRFNAAYAAALTVPDSRPLWLAPAQELPHLRALPLGACPFISIPSRQYLETLGLTHLGELAGLLASQWSRRIPEGALLHALVTGIEGSVQPQPLPPVLQEQLDLVLEPEADTHAAILYYLQPLLEAACQRWARLGLQCDLLRLTLLARDGKVLETLELRLSQARSSAGGLLTLLRLRLEALTLPCPVAEFQLLVPAFVRARPSQGRDLLGLASGNSQDLGRLLDRLAAAGEGAVGACTIQVAPHPMPELRCQEKPLKGQAPPPAAQATLAAHATQAAHAESGSVSPSAPILAAHAVSGSVAPLPVYLLASPLPLDSPRARQARPLPGEGQFLEEVETPWWKQPFQRRSYRWLLCRNGAALLVFDTGLEDRPVVQGIFK
jgi:protein ImuB